MAPSGSSTHAPAAAQARVAAPLPAKHSRLVQRLARGRGGAQASGLGLEGPPAAGSAGHVWVGASPAAASGRLAPRAPARA
eukprot:334249-Pyramimonas_sp.AAC.1